MIYTQTVHRYYSNNNNNNKAIVYSRFRPPLGAYRGVYLLIFIIDRVAGENTFGSVRVFVSVRLYQRSPV